jgi:hypothetical protein
MAGCGTQTPAKFNMFIAKQLAKKQERWDMMGQLKAEIRILFSRELQSLAILSLISSIWGGHLGQILARSHVFHQNGTTNRPTYQNLTVLDIHIHMQRILKMRHILKKEILRISPGTDGHSRNRDGLG